MWKTRDRFRTHTRKKVAANDKKNDIIDSTPPLFSKSGRIAHAYTHAHGWLLLPFCIPCFIGTHCALACVCVCVKSARLCACVRMPGYRDEYCRTHCANVFPKRIIPLPILFQPCYIQSDAVHCTHSTATLSRTRRKVEEGGEQEMISYGISKYVRRVCKDEILQHPHIFRRIPSSRFSSPFGAPTELNMAREEEEEEALISSKWWSAKTQFWCSCGSPPYAESVCVLREWFVCARNSILAAQWCWRSLHRHPYICICTEWIWKFLELYTKMDINPLGYAELTGRCESVWLICIKPYAGHLGTLETGKKCKNIHIHVLRVRCGRCCWLR